MGGARAGGAAVGASGGSGQRAACSRAATARRKTAIRLDGAAARQHTRVERARAESTHSVSSDQDHTTRPLPRVGVARTRLAGVLEEARRRARSTSARWTTAARASSGAREVEHQVSRPAGVASPPSSSLRSFGARRRLGDERDDRLDPGLFGRVNGGPWQPEALGIRRIGQHSEEKGRLGAVCSHRLGANLLVLVLARRPPHDAAAAVDDGVLLGRRLRVLRCLLLPTLGS